MKVIPVATPSHAPTNNTTTTSSADARSRAIAALTGETKQAQAPVITQEYPVANANNISAEEISAIKQTSQAPEIIDESTITEDTQPPKIEEPPKKDPVLEKQFQELARQERILRAKAQKQAQELNTQKQALDAQKQALDARTKEYETGYIPRDRIKAETLQVLAEAGISYDDLTQQLLTQQPRDPRVEAQLSALQNEIKALRAEKAEDQKSAVQQQTEAYTQALKQIERDVTTLVSSDPSAYEAIAKTKSARDVVELIEETYKKDGILLTVEEAAQEVEDYLVDQYVTTGSRIDKIKKRLVTETANVAQSKPVDPKTQASPKQTQPTQMKTLTNAASSTRKLSGRERALLAFKGELKS